MIRLSSPLSSSQILYNTKADRFLEQLQNTMMPRKRGGLEEPLLIAVPMRRASDLVFPFAVVSRPTSTAKQVEPGYSFPALLAKDTALSE
jgi:hypothetical protein